MHTINGPSMSTIVDSVWYMNEWFRLVLFLRKFQWPAALKKVKQ